MLKINQREGNEYKQGLILMRLFQGLAGQLLLVVGMIGITPLVVSAASYEEIEQLNSAYPAGSVIVCRADLPGNGSELLPVNLVIRADVKARKGKHTVYDVSVTWLTKSEAARGLTLTYRMTQRSDKTGQYSKIDPESMAVSIPDATPEDENSVLKGFRNRFTVQESFTPYSQIEITDFPSYISRNPGEEPISCSKE